MAHINGNRYVLLWIVGGQPQGVHPVNSLRHAQDRLRELLQRDGCGWHLFDLQTESLIEPEAAFAMAS